MAGRSQLAKKPGRPAREKRIGGRFTSSVQRRKLRPPSSFSSTPGKAYHFCSAVPLFVSVVVDPVVPETAEIETRQRVCRVAPRVAGR